MDNTLLLIAVLILLFSIVQSVFGIGLLAFGTPSLLLLGYSFSEALFFVLPCSLMISFLQVLHDRRHIKGFSRSFLIFCIPCMAIGLVFINKHGTIDAQLPVGIMLILTALTRISEAMLSRLKRFLTRFERSYLVGLGLIHGTTNMGGGLLAILINTVYESKNQIRANIAFAYLLMASVQLAIVGIQKPEVFQWPMACFPVISLAAFFLFGQRIFKMAGQKGYQQAMSVFMLVFGVVLVVFWSLK